MNIYFIGIICVVCTVNEYLGWGKVFVYGSGKDCWDMIHFVSQIYAEV